MPGKHRGEPVSAKDKRAKQKAQDEDDTKFWEDVAEAVGLRAGDPDDPRLIKGKTKGKHRAK